MGVIDERAKKFSRAERRIAEYLADKGPAVVSVSEGFGACGRTADDHVDGTPVEFKSLDPGADDQTVKAALNSAKGQARYAVIEARDCGLTELEIRDTGDDQQRQQAIGGQLFHALESGRRWPVVYIDDMQKCKGTG